ncbi:MAG: hypothetical protein ACREL7_14255 [Longimicrobiales bacterium]
MQLGGPSCRSHHIPDGALNQNRAFEHVDGLHIDAHAVPPDLLASALRVFVLDGPQCSRARSRFADHLAPERFVITVDAFQLSGEIAVCLTVHRIHMPAVSADLLSVTTRTV